MKHVPFVVYEAHAKCKALGPMPESEPRSLVIANLRRLRLARFGAHDEVRFRPAAITAYIERCRAAVQAERPDEIEAGPEGEARR